MIFCYNLIDDQDQSRLHSQGTLRTRMYLPLVFSRLFLFCDIIKISYREKRGLGTTLMFSCAVNLKPEQPNVSTPIGGLQSIPCDLKIKTRQSCWRKTYSEYNATNEILLFKFLQHGQHNVKCKPRIAKYTQSRRLPILPHFILTES